MSMPRLLIAVAAAVLLLAGLSGCNPRRYQARVEGDRVYVPQASSMLRYERSTTRDLPFVQFDGQYPREWPEAVMLPEDSYLRKQGSLTGKRNTYGFLGEFDGICRGTPESVMEDWKQRIRDHGWTYSFDDPDVQKSYPEGMADNYLKIFASQPGINASHSARIIIYKHSNMDGWVHFSGYVDIGDF